LKKHKHFPSSTHIRGRKTITHPVVEKDTEESIACEGRLLV
jgi:hypothetical protein